MTTPNKAARVHISGDGTTRGTTVTNLETGEKIAPVSAVAFTHRAGKAPHAVIDVMVPSIDVTCEAVLIASPAKPISSDAAIEAEIQAKGLTAPRVTPADVEAAIASEHYYTGKEGALGMHPSTTAVRECPAALSGVLHCVLVMKVGGLATGESFLQDLSKPDPERARASARRRAFDKAYDMVVFAERKRLAQGGVA